MDWWKLKLYRWMLSPLEEGGTQNPVEWNKPLFLSITLLAALYRRRIPALTMTVARRGIPSAWVCGNNQKRCTPGFYRVYDSRVCPSCSPALCEGGRNRACIQERATVVARYLCQEVLMKESHKFNSIMERFSAPEREAYNMHSLSACCNIAKY